MFCGWCKHSGLHATIVARGATPTRCSGCSACKREDEKEREELKK